MHQPTEPKWAEEGGREGEARFQAIFEQAAVGMALVGLNGCWLRVNRKLCDIVGYCYAELMGLTFQAITHPAELQTDLDYGRRALRRNSGGRNA